MVFPLTFSITPDFLSSLPDGSIAVVAHDAGAASHILAWLAPLHSKLRLCLAGPAELLFRSRLGPSVSFFSNLEDALMGALVLITGTGWATTFEHSARRLASQQSIPCIAVLDHWVNYRERFQIDGEEILPAQLWVADEYAAALARAEFPNLYVLQLPNLWLESTSKEVSDIRRLSAAKQPRHPRLPARRLIYLLEPIRFSWSKNATSTSEAGEFQGLRYLLQQLPHLQKLGWVAPQHELEALVLRPHPSDPSGKYDALIAQTSVDLPIYLDSSSSLVEALAWADAAFGCETQALVAALACGLPAFSTLPPWSPPCRLPHASLLHIRHMNHH